MDGQPSAPALEVASALQDLAWLLPRTIGAIHVDGLERLPATELELMRLLVRLPGRTLSEAAEELAMQPSNASTAVRTLVARGLVERQRDARDRRMVRLVPTKRAQRNRRRHEQIWGQELEDRLDLLSDEQAQLILAAAPALRALAGVLTGSLE